MNLQMFILIAMIVFSSIGNAQVKDSTEIRSVTEREKFDPTRDAEKDIKIAVKEAQNNNKNILIDVGGEWCIWCHRLDNFILENPDLNNFLYENFIVVKVNFSPENKNEKFLSKYPKIKGYPHFFVLNSNGEFIHSQSTGDLEQGKGYSKEKIFAFLKEWAPKKSIGQK